MKSIRIFAVLFFLTLLSGCGSGKNASGSFYKRNVEVSYYADKFNGNKTASGEKFSNSKKTAAHRTLSFGTKIKVTNVANGKSVIVTINDRGPQKQSRELDLSKSAFMEITDNKNHGTLKVNMQIVK
ncbi:septal ring lytic transglycosylase RlpA family protein [Flavobacterium pallidum]|uniref:Probable endolytic peptidoglycan transglycosylase RlpA n=1 Tax=Flavobacterium pallidum TaxID=2172098 RepID=A0A2S1SF28_9FLAO|nr:septal ring lytic transglycosylase RlpA family protein [Flavobacterium pallidum]AWI24971.1 septal ring lytic transglycosylase RlpA family lipoprotein [Flavobacterium pallidum]